MITVYCCWKESKIPLLVNLNQEQPWQIELATDKLPALHTRLCKSSQRCHVPTQVNTKFKNFKWIKTNKHFLWQGRRPKYCPSGRRKVSEKRVRFTCCFLGDALALQKLIFAPTEAEFELWPESNYDVWDRFQIRLPTERSLCSMPWHKVKFNRVLSWVGEKGSKLVVPLMSVASPLPVFSELTIS